MTARRSQRTRADGEAQWPADGRVALVADVADFRATLEIYPAVRPAGHPIRAALQSQ